MDPRGRGPVGTVLVARGHALLRRLRVRGDERAHGRLRDRAADHAGDRGDRARRREPGEPPGAAHDGRPLRPDRARGDADDHVRERGRGRRVPGAPRGDGGAVVARALRSLLWPGAGLDGNRPCGARGGCLRGRVPGLHLRLARAGRRPGGSARRVARWASRRRRRRCDRAPARPSAAARGQRREPARTRRRDGGRRRRRRRSARPCPCRSRRARGRRDRTVASRRDRARRGRHDRARGPSGRRRMRPRRRVVYHWRVMADSKPAALQETAAAPFVVATERVKPHAKLIALLALGHLVIDLNQGSIPALLPFLRTAHGLSYAEAAMIVLVGNVTSSLIQPLFGYVSDQIARRWILPTSVFLSGVGLALMGVAPGYLTVLALVLVTALGVAAWHP